MSRARRRFLFTLVGASVLAGLVYWGVPWWVNSGRATAVLEQWFSTRLGNPIQLTDPSMRGWSRFSVERINVAIDANQVSVMGFDTPGPRYKGDPTSSAESILIRVSAPAVGSGAPAGQDPSSAPALRIPRLSPRVRQALGWMGEFRAPVRVEVESSDEARSVEAEGDVFALQRDANTAEIRLNLQSLSAHVPASTSVDATLDLESGVLVSVSATARGPWNPLLGRIALTDLKGEAGMVDVALTTKDGQVFLEWSQPALHAEGINTGSTTGKATANLGVPLADMDWKVEAELDSLRLGNLLEVGPAAFSTSLRINPAASTAIWSAAQLRPHESDLGIELDGTFNLNADGSPIKSAVRVESMTAAQWAEYSPLVRRLMSDAPAVDGLLGLQADVEWSEATKRIQAEWEWNDGSVAVDDFRQAAGLRMTLTTTGTRTNAEPWQIGADGAIGGGEVLWGQWYQSFAEQEFPLSLTAAVLPDWSGFSYAQASMNLGGLGQWSIAGPIGFDGGLQNTEVQIRDFRLDDAVTTLLVPLFVGTRPWVEDASGAGALGLTVTVTRTETGWESNGRLSIEDGAILDVTDNVAFTGIRADLPFELHGGTPPEQQSVDPKLGTLAFGGLHVGNVKLEGAELPIQLWDNAFVFASPYRSSLFGGALSLDAMWGINVLSNNDREWQAEVTMENIDLDQLSHAFEGFVPLTGELNGRFSRIHFAGGDLDATGAIEATIYDGAFYLTQFGIEDLRSPYRTYTADIAWDNIDLEKATSTLGFGRITGKLKGAIRGLAVQAGQPAAFDAEFATVPTPDVSQRLSVQAVNNISVLGTGRGLGGILSRGLTQFFDDFKYETMGFRCTLRNDRFRIRGVAGDDQGEYFVKGTFLPPTINVINRDPKTTISFREMVRRFSAVDMSRIGGGSPREGTDSP